VRDRGTRSVIIERLKRRSDFRAAASGVRAAGRAFVLQARSRGDDGAVRVGFTVSGQVGTAVERNRVRRRLREMVRLSAAAGLRPGLDYVLIGRRAALAVPFGDLMRELNAALSQIHGQVQHGGTGASACGALHEASSRSQTPGPRQIRRTPPKPTREPQE
jgi:ribonuclease P protein component